MFDDSMITGIVLLAVVPLIVFDGTASLRAGFDSAFWERPLSEKMDHLVDRQAAWHRLGLVWVFIGLLLAGGFTGFAFQLAGAGEGAWAGVGLGVFLLSTAMFVSMIVLMVTTVSTAAEIRRTSGEMPAWVGPVWRSAWWLERAFVVGANLAYVAWGVGILAAGEPAAWAGWIAIVSGGLIALWASVKDFFFQHMALVTPIALGVALVLD